MRKSLKIGLGIFGVTTIGAISLASVISCSSKSNNDTTSSSASSSSSSSSNNLSYIPYSDLSTTVIKNGDSNTPWTYATALASWQKIFSTYNYKNAVENAINSFFNDWSNYQNSFVKQDYESMNQNAENDNLNYTSSLEISNTSIAYNSNGTFNLKFDIAQNNYWINTQNKKELLYAKYSSSIIINGATFVASFDTLPTLYTFNTSSTNYGEITMESANLLQVNSASELIDNYHSLTSSEIINLINNNSSVKYQSSSQNIEKSNYSHEISSTTSSSDSFSFISTYQNGIYYGEFQNSQNSNN